MIFHKTDTFANGCATRPCANKETFRQIDGLAWEAKNFGRNIGKIFSPNLNCTLILPRHLNLT